MARSIQNPQGMLQNWASKDEDLRNAMNEAQGDWQKAFGIYAGKKGINPNDVLSQLR